MMDSVRLLVTTIPGLEDVTVAEASEKLSLKSFEVKPGQVAGRVILEVSEEEASKVFRLRSIEHVIRLLKIFPVEASLKGLDTIYRELYGLEVELGSTFRITCERVGSHDYTSIDVQRVAGQALVDRYGTKVNLKNPETIVRVDVAREWCFVGVQLTRQPLHIRYLRVFQHPSALNPVIAYGMLRLSGLKSGETLLDAFCGGGTIIIEAAQAWENLEALGIDISPKNIEGAWKNAESAGVKDKVNFMVADACRLERFLPEGWKADREVSNLPFGIRSGRLKALPKIYRGFLSSVKSFLSRSAMLCLLTARRNILESSALEEGYEVAEARKIAYGGLESWIIRLKPP
ncbi:hypothetical protein DRO53_00805 [Candidatus Bathyarchaeota archaeon]|nr:MAG: hypothetical protein DRO53_00805 [Candidatus Bathyarchaeota archaeon]